MTEADEVALALTICLQAHEGQKRKFSDEPYSNHPIRVASMVKCEASSALLHDVLEDTDWTPTMLKDAGMSAATVMIVKVLTRKPKEPYYDYIIRVFHAGGVTRNIKMADLQDIDLALLPVGGKFTMNAAKAASAAKEIRAVQCLPYHWGTIIGRESDARQFAELAGDTAVVLTPGESLIVGGAGGAA